MLNPKVGTYVKLLGGDPRFIGMIGRVCGFTSGGTTVLILNPQHLTLILYYPKNRDIEESPDGHNHWLRTSFPNG